MVVYSLRDATFEPMSRLRLNDFNRNDHRHALKCAAHVAAITS